MPARRRYQYSLRALLLLVLLVAVGALFWRTAVEPYRRQRRTMELIQELGGTFQTTPADRWVRWLHGGDYQHLKFVNLADGDDPSAYIDRVAALPAIQTLVVGGPAFADDHLRRLHGLTTLKGLVLDSTSVTDDGLAALRNALPDVDAYRSDRRAIKVLGLYGDVITEPGSVPSRLRQAVGDEWYQEAKRFRSYHARDGVRPDNAKPTTDEALAYIGMLRSLESLDLGRLLSDVSVSDAGLRHLQELTRLRVLILTNTPVGDEGIAHLKRLAELRYLALCGTQVSDSGLAHLRSLTNLTALTLAHTSISDAGLIHLAGLAQLQLLDLCGTKVSGAGLVHLTELRKLEMLDLGYTHVTDADCGPLARMTALVGLDLRGAKVGTAAKAELCRALPGCRVLAAGE